MTHEASNGEAVVERVARAIYNYQNGKNRPWDDLSPPMTVSWKRCAEAALSAINEKEGE